MIFGQAVSIGVGEAFPSSEWVNDATAFEKSTSNIDLLRTAFSNLALTTQLAHSQYQTVQKRTASLNSLALPAYVTGISSKASFPFSDPFNDQELGGTISGPHSPPEGLSSSGSPNSVNSLSFSGFISQEVPGSPNSKKEQSQLSSKDLYKTELCRSFSETGTCRYGTRCQFAHGLDELRPVHRHPKYKTAICKTFHTQGTCPYGTRCRFIHQINNGSTTDIYGNTLIFANPAPISGSSPLLSLSELSCSDPLPISGFQNLSPDIYSQTIARPPPGLSSTSNIAPRKGSLASTMPVRLVQAEKLDRKSLPPMENNSFHNRLREIAEEEEDTPEGRERKNSGSRLRFFETIAPEKQAQLIAK